jgi:hypothetical protein
MKSILRSKAAKITAAVVACFALFAGGVAFASSHRASNVTYSGGSLVQTKVATDENGWGTNTANTWQKVTGSTVKVVVPSHVTRLLNARFMAESYCTGDTAWCSVRIVARKGSGTPQEFRPRVADDFAFDAPGGEEWEGNSVDRSLRLSSGTWYVWVQGFMEGGTTGSMYLDDWHFEVDVFK